MIWVNLWSDFKVTEHVIHNLQMGTISLLPKCYRKALSPATTNEILNDFSCSVLTERQQDTQKAKYYAIILDELGKYQLKNN